MLTTPPTLSPEIYYSTRSMTQQFVAPLLVHELPTCFSQRTSIVESKASNFIFLIVNPPPTLKVNAPLSL